MLIAYLDVADANLSIDERLRINQLSDEKEIGGILKTAAINELPNAESYATELHKVIGELSRASQGKTTPADLYKEIVWNMSGTPYSSISGMNIAKCFFAEKFQGVDEPVDLERIVITEGVSEGISTFFECGHFQPGDKVIAIEPFYPPYQLLADKYKLDLIPVPAHSSGYIARHPANILTTILHNWDESEKAKVKSIIVINPSNPTGGTLADDEYRAIIRLADGLPNCVICEDTVYSSFSSDFRYAHSACLTFKSKKNLPKPKNMPIITFTSVSKAEEQAGLRVGAAYINKSAEDVFRREGLLGKVEPRATTATELFARTKDAPAYHTHFPASSAQIRAAIVGTHDRLTGHTGEFREHLRAVRAELHKLFDVTVEDKKSQSNYYFWRNMLKYAEKYFDKRDISPELKSRVLAGLDIPEVILRCIEQEGVLVFDGATFFPKAGLPSCLRGTDYEQAYNAHYTKDFKPEMCIRVALANNSASVIIDAMEQLKYKTDEHIQELISACSA
jgi:aspartate/methionine/tyrosine aminotransferase